MSYIEKLVCGEAIEEMEKLADKSIDLICCDLPYGTTNNSWDTIIPLEPMWEQFHRICKDNAAIVLNSAQPFTSLLVVSNLKNFRYDLVWEKTISSGQLNIKRQPMRSHESILVFYKKQPTYNEQLTKGEPYSIVRKGKYQTETYNSQKASTKVNDGYRHAKSVIKISNPRIKGGHPTQKPVALTDYIVKTYSNENDTVLDCCMGFGTTGISTVSLKRKFIGIELDAKYFIVASENIQEADFT